MKRVSSDTRKILTAVEVVSMELSGHTRLDDMRHEENTTKLDKIGKDVESLLATRSFTRGIWRAAVVGGTVAGSVISLIIAWLKP